VIYATEAWEPCGHKEPTFDGARLSSQPRHPQNPQRASRPFVQLKHSFNLLYKSVMPSFSKSLLAAVHVAVFSTLLITPSAPVSALASPVPMPFQLMTANYYAVNRSTAYRRPAIRNKTAMRKSTRVKHAAAAASRNDTAGVSLARRAGTVTISKNTSKISSNGRRAEANNADGSDYYAKLNGYYNAASTHAKNIRMMPLHLVVFYADLIVRVPRRAIIFCPGRRLR
jgi:hypothetical protein